jgi:hypothetical protein
MGHVEQQQEIKNLPFKILGNWRIACKMGIENDCSKEFGRWDKNGQHNKI